MKKIMQFRYYRDNSSFNYPIGLTGEVLASGELFGPYGSVSSLGIQGPPGLKFHLNNSSNPIVIGKTGIYQLDTRDVNRITSIEFPGLGTEKSDLSQKSLLTESSKLIIDIVYGGGL